MADITINLRADPSQFESGVKSAEAAIEEWENSSGDSADEVAKKLEQVIRTLVKLGTQSGKSYDDMVDDLRKFGLTTEQAEEAIEAVWEEMRDGKSAARDVEKSADAFEDVEKKADGAADATSKVGDASKKTGADVSELGNIARDVLEGDFGSAAEGAIGALSSIGLFAGAGGALGTLVGQGVVAIGGMFVEQWKAAAEETKKNIASMYDDMTQSGLDYLSEAEIQARIDNVFKDDKKYEEAKEAAKLLGLSVGEVAAAWASTGEARDLYMERASEGLARAGEETKSTTSYQVNAYEEVIGKIQEQVDAQEEATQRAHEQRDAVDLVRVAVDGVSGALAKVPPDKRIYLTADTTDVDAAIERLRRQRLSTRVDVDYVINERRGRQVF